MRREYISTIVLAFFLPLLLIACGNRTDPRKLEFNPIKFDAPKTERTLLENGTIVHLLNDRELPLINMVVRVKGGSIYNPVGKEGLADLTTALIRSGGVKGMISSWLITQVICFHGTPWACSRSPLARTLSVVWYVFTPTRLPMRSCGPLSGESART